MENNFDFTIIGGGIVGLATAYKLQLKYPQLKLLVLEKEDHFAPHQTGHNSGVIHSGIYYKPGSYKAKNCVDGRHQIVAFAKEHSIDHDICGKIIVATDESEFPFLDIIHQNGIKNNVEDIEIIGPERIKEIEPYCVGIKGLRVGCTGIIDFVGVTNKLAELIIGINPESKTLTNHEVTGIRRLKEQTTIITNKGDFI